MKTVNRGPWTVDRGTVAPWHRAPVPLCLLLVAALAVPAAAQQNPQPAPQPTPQTGGQAGTPLAGTVQGAMRRGWFGISLSCEDCYIQRGPGRVAYTRLPAIYSVESGSPAAQAGLRNGDTLVSVDGQLLTTPEGFERFAASLPGVPVRVGLRRAGVEREVTVTPGENPSMRTTLDYYNERLRIAQRRGVEALRSAFRSPLGWLGMAVECESCSITSMGSRSQSMRFRQAPAVLTVDVDGPAHRGGLRRGDTLTAIDGVDLTTSEGGRAFSAIEPGQRVTLTVRRDGRERRVLLTAVARPDASREELAAFEEYRRGRDSAETMYRELVTAAVARAQAEMRDMERLLRELDLNRGMVDSTRRRLTSVDSVLRSLRTLERARASSFGYTTNWPPSVAVAPTAPTPPTPAAAAAPPTPPMPGGVYEVSPGIYAPTPRTSANWQPRYSNRIGDVNVEVRAPATVTATEVGDSLVVIVGPGMEVRVARRAPRR